MALEINESVTGNISVLKLRGFVDTSTSSMLEDGVQKLVENGKNKIVIDLTDVEFVSSAGWGVLVAYLRKIRAEGGDIALAGMIEKVRKVYELMQFDALIDSYESVEEAAKSFS